MTHSVKFRKKILKESEEKGVVVTAQKYSLSTRSINQWKKCLEPKTTRKRTGYSVSRIDLLQDVKDFPNDYQHERAERFCVSRSCIQYSLKMYGITNKKISVKPK